MSTDFGTRTYSDTGVLEVQPANHGKVSQEIITYGTSTIENLLPMVPKSSPTKTGNVLDALQLLVACVTCFVIGYGLGEDRFFSRRKKTENDR